MEQRFPLQPVPSVPEIRLHMAGPRSRVWQLAEADPGFGTPYWAYAWGGGLALARHILDTPALVAGRRVLDIGTGSGLVAIAAAKAGAASVIAVDVDRYAVAAAEANAAANGVVLDARLGDATETPPPDVDIVLAADLFYEANLAARVTNFLARCAEAGIDVLVGDPGRAFLPTDRLRQLADYPGGDFGDRAGAGRNSVFALCRP